MTYSQYEEQDLILKFFNGRIGTFWDIGAGDGITNSNTRRLWEVGWTGYLFEASPETYRELEKNYGNKERAHAILMAIGPKEDMVKFYHHPTISGWSSMNEAWVEPWKASAIVHEMPCLPISVISNVWRQPNFLSIDTEGMDAVILESMPEHFTPELIVAETDKPGAKARIDAEMKRRGYEPQWETIGNTAYAKT